MHYSVLSLLLCLAESPTNAEYSPVDLDGSKLDDKIHVCAYVYAMLEGVTFIKFMQKCNKRRCVKPLEYHTARYIRHHEG